MNAILKRIFTECFAMLPAMAMAATPATAPPAIAPSIPAPPAENLRRTVVVDVAEKTKNAVVYISTTRTVTGRASSGDPFFDSLGAGPMVTQRVGSLGSGFIVHKDGYVVTNHHVIDRAREIKVELLDGRKFSAELISSNPEADLAILKIKSDKPLPTLELGDSSDLMIGEPVIAVGNPFGFSHSVSSGIVSALHRDLQGRNHETVLADLIQTDAAINPGNSGGPLLNAYGQVIGIDTAIRSDAQNIGFAIPINHLRDIIPELMNPTHVNRIEFPVKLTEVRKITEPATIQTTVKIADSEETVQSIAGQKPRDIIDAYAILLRQKVTQDVEIVTDKGTKQFKPKPVPVANVVVQAKDKLGLTVEQMTPMAAGKVGTDQETGVLIDAVNRGSVGWNAGLQPGDIIVQLGQFPISTLDDLAALLPYLPKKGKVYVGAVRPGEPRVGRAFLEF